MPEGKHLLPNLFHILNYTQWIFKHNFGQGNLSSPYVTIMSSCVLVQLCPTLCDSRGGCWASPCMEFSRQEYWSGLPFPPPGESSWLRDWTSISCVSCIGKQIIYTELSVKPIYYHKDTRRYLLGGTVFKNQPCNSGDSGLIPGGELTSHLSCSTKHNTYAATTEPEHHS